MAITQEVEVLSVIGQHGYQGVTHDHDEAGDCGPDYIETVAGNVSVVVRSAGHAVVTLNADEARAFAVELAAAIEIAEGEIEDLTAVFAEAVAE